MDIQSVKKVNIIDKDILGSYALTDTDGKIHYVPLDKENTEYIKIQKWVADGNTIEEAD